MKLKTMFKWILLIFFLTCLSSCKTHTVIQEVPVEVEKLKIEYRDKYVRDSIYIQDSTLTTVRDSIIYVYKWRVEYRDKYFRDTIRITDSIEKPVYVTKTEQVITNKLTKFQQIMMWLGIFFCGGLITYLIKKFK